MVCWVPGGRLTLATARRPVGLISVRSHGAVSCGCPCRHQQFHERAAHTLRSRQRRWQSTASADPGSHSSELSPRLLARLQERLDRYLLLLEQSSSVDLDDDDRRKLAREITQLERGAQGMQQLCELKSEAQSLEALREDPEAEAELRQMATEELLEVDAARRQLEKQLLHSLIPKDDVEDGNVMLEIRAGAGGDEASIFAADLYNMYTKYAFSSISPAAAFCHCS